jgi:hypothetical protein
MTKKQCIFGWFDSMLGQESVVRRLMRFEPDRVDGRNGRHIEGKLYAVNYGQWLRWYSPLCERGQS